MTHNNVPILIITAPPPASDNQNQDTITQALKQHRPDSHNRGNGNKSNPRVRKPQPNDKSEPFRRKEVSISYNNASLLSIEKKLHDESVLDNMSISSRSIFSTESPRDIKTVTTLKPNSYYLGVINPNEPSRISQNNPKSLYVGRSVFPSITLDESNINIHKNEGSTVIENDPKNAVKVSSLSSVQTKRPPSIGNKLYHGFRRPYASQNLNDQTESFEMPRLGSPQQNDLKPPASEKTDKEKHAEEPVHVPRPPSKGPLNKARTLAPPPALDHRRPKKVGTEASSIVVKSNLDLDSKAYNSVPIDYTPQSMINLPSQDNTLEAGSLVIDPNSMMKHHRRLRPDIDRRAINRTSLNGRSLKDNELYPHSDVSNSQAFYQSIKIPLKPLSGNANGAKRALNSRGPNSELRGSSKDDLMKRFNDIVAYQLQPGQAGNPQVLPEKNKNEGNGLRAGASSKEKEHTKRRPVKPQDENKQTGSEVQKGKKPAEVSIINPTDAKIMMLKNKIKDKEYKRKTRKNQCLEEGEGGMIGIPLKSKFAEHMENKGEMEEDMKKRLLVMRKIQLYDILIKQKTGKKLKKEVLKLVKTEFDKVNQELSELKLHEH